MLLGRAQAVSYLLLFLIAACFHCPTVLGEPAFTHIYMNPPMYIAKETGELFDIAISISFAENLHSCRLKITFNSSLLEAVQVSQADFFPQDSIFEYNNDQTQGLVAVNITLAQSSPPLNGNGTLIRITFQVTDEPAMCTASTIRFDESQLLDPTGEPVNHRSVCAVFFWRSVYPDPPGELFIDLATQKGGEDLQEPGGCFFTGQLVNLTSYVTYNDWPIQEGLVAFQVQNPLNETVLVRVAKTDEEGFAEIYFRIPDTPESVGLWTAFSTFHKEEVVWDTVTFWVYSPHGPTAKKSHTPEIPYVNTTVFFDASSSLPGFNGTHEMPITEYRWDFGDGIQTITSNPTVTHIFERTGIYYVTLTVYAPGATPETNSTVQKVMIIPWTVGGYSLPIERDTTAEPLKSHPATILILILFITKIGCEQKNVKKKPQDTLEHCVSFAISPNRKS